MSSRRSPNIIAQLEDIQSQRTDRIAARTDQLIATLWQLSTLSEREYLERQWGNNISAESAAYKESEERIHGYEQRIAANQSHLKPRTSDLRKEYNELHTESLPLVAQVKNKQNGERLAAAARMAQIQSRQAQIQVALQTAIPNNDPGNAALTRDIASDQQAIADIRAQHATYSERKYLLEMALTEPGTALSSAIQQKYAARGQLHIWQDICRYVELLKKGKIDVVRNLITLRHESRTAVGHLTQPEQDVLAKYGMQEGVRLSQKAPNIIRPTNPNILRFDEAKEMLRKGWFFGPEEWKKVFGFDFHILGSKPRT